MSFSFSRLFKQTSPVEDGLTQSEREAIADLLHYCLYADNHIALAETAVLNDIISTLSWDPNTSFSSFEGRSVSAAREAKENAAAREEFLQSIRGRLSKPQVRTLAFDLCKQLFVADGAQSDKETVVLARIQQLLT
jgi:uncharacterized tellurite resistance protein B-like protein